MNKHRFKISILLVSTLFISACATNTNTSSVSSTSSAITPEDSSQTSVDEIVIDQPVMKLETQGMSSSTKTSVMNAFVNRIILTISKF